MNFPLVSIIIPCKNAAPFLRECLDSIVSQSYTNWEAIICDDGSTDQSENIVQTYCDNYRSFKSIKNPQIGIISALKNAYLLAKGEYITRMDADDIMPAKKIETLLSLLIQNPENKVATGKVKYFAENEVNEGFRNYENWLNNLVDSKSHWKEIFKECVIASPCWMMHKLEFEKIGGFNAEEYPEDYDLVWRMYANKIEIRASHVVLHLWRDHEQRASRNLAEYKAQTYFDLKIKYMIETERLREHNIAIWGAGKKGKALAKVLEKNCLTFEWFTNNPKKIGAVIYGVTLQDHKILKNSKEIKKTLVTVSNFDEQREIKLQLVAEQQTQSIDFFIMA